MGLESTPLQKAWLTINKLKERLQNQTIVTHQPIAIIGLSCRLAQVNNSQDYWELLRSGKNVISTMPESRWELLKNTQEYFERDKNHPYWGSFLENVADFDAYFFGISPREALRMDLQQRWLLAVSYEAFNDAGLSYDSLAESNTGVFVSLYANPFGYLQKLENDMDALFILTGNAQSIAANRLSYLFDLSGPSMVIDTACSSSLVAIHLACLHLQNKLCDTALVSAVNLNLFPSINYILAEAKMLSPDGQCKTFDADANGYVQGEGAGALVLKPLNKAIADKDQIYAVIAATGVNQDGKTNGLTAPNGLRQEKLLSSIYASSHINPAHLSYVECHGTGTFLGDPIEVQALGETISKGRNKNQPCWIGSVKTNIGHLEPAAGIASVIKVALALKYAQIPPHLNVKTRNPLIEFDKYHFLIPQKIEAWPEYGEYRMAGINGFGFGGTNAHLVLRELTKEEKTSALVSINNDATDIPEIFTLSAKDPAALKQLITDWCFYLKENPTIPLNQLCYNTHVKQSHFFYRLAIIAYSTSELYQTLCCIEDNETKDLTNVFMHEEGQELTKLENNAIDVDDDLKQLAIAYLNHEPINWQEREASRHFAKINMPGYPWQQKTYWPTLQNLQKEWEADSIDLYPFQGQVISSPLKTLQFNFTFTIDHLPEIQDTFNILHAGYYIEMLAFAAVEMQQCNTFVIQDLQFDAPIIIPKESAVGVQLLIKAAAEHAFTFYSLSAGQSQWKEHAKAKSMAVVNFDAIPILDTIANIKTRTKENGLADQFYGRVRAMDMPADGSVRWIHQYWLGNKEILCELKQPDLNTNNDVYKLKIHFSVIDACIQALFLTLPKQFNHPYVAMNFGRFTFFGMKHKKLYLYATLTSISEMGEEYEGDWYLMNEDNELIASCSKMKMKRLSTNIKIERIRQVKDEIDFDWAPLSREKRKQKILNYLIDQAANIFSMPQEDVDILQSLNQMGIDSLMALVLMRAIETGLGVTYSMQEILKGPSLADIADYVLSEKEQQTENTFNLPNNISAFQPATANPWIAFKQTKKTAKFRLFCFPFGGAGASIYRDWGLNLPESIEVYPIQLPGREDRIQEKPIDNLQELVTALIENLKPELNVPFAFFGHSFGSLIAFELARQLKEQHLPEPVYLYVSAYPDPSKPTQSLDNLISQLALKGIDLLDLKNSSLQNLSVNQLTDLVNIFNENGMTDYSMEAMNADAIKLLLPIFISDMHLVKSYEYKPNLQIDVPIMAFSGKQDTWVLADDMQGWKNMTSQSCIIREVNGGHLFIQNKEKLQEVLLDISTSLINEPKN